MRRTATAVGITLMLVGCGGDEPLPIPAECNGAVALCARGFAEVAYATTHNAMSNEEDEWINPNQYFGITHQLENGIRGLMLDAHPYEDGVFLCHGICQLGNKPLADGLAEIETFLAQNRGEVVTIIFESYITAADMAQAFNDSGLIDYVFAPGIGPWPTLREMIDADTRLVVLTDSEGGAYPWYVDVWAQAWETHFSARETTDFSCAPNRGNTGNPLFIFNHFLTQTKPVPEQAATTNANPLLIDRARQCQTESGALPNFVTVDFYSVGDTLAAVQELNGGTELAF